MLRLGCRAHRRGRGPHDDDVSSLAARSFATGEGWDLDVAWVAAPGVRRATAGAVVTGKLANSSSHSDGKLLLGAGYVKRHGVDSPPQCLSFTFFTFSRSAEGGGSRGHPSHTAGVEQSSNGRAKVHSRPGNGYLNARNCVQIKPVEAGISAMRRDYHR